MKRKAIRAVALRGFAVVLVVGAACQVRAEDAKTPYPKMALVEQYMMERNARLRWR